jgi:CRP-like cAMP-binding protein
MGSLNRAGNSFNNRSSVGLPKSDSNGLESLKAVKPQFSNRILAALPKSDLDRLNGQLKLIQFKQHDSLSQAGEESRFAYFLEDGMASVVSELKGGGTVEVGLVGREGLVNLPGVTGTGSMPFHSFIQIAGQGYRIKTEVVASLFQRSAIFREKVLNLLHAQLVQTAQTAACNRRHEVTERLARWLLSCRDRGDSDDVRLTQEFLGQMLGAPRTTVTLAAMKLQNAELIEYSRGSVRILNQRRLEKAACECYCVIRDEFIRLDVM